MSFLHNRVVSIRRTNSRTGVGVQSTYGGATELGETVLLTGLPANIAQNRERTAMPSGVPNDSSARAGFRVNIPLRACSDPTAIKERDIVQDDIGKRYVVNASGFTSMGYRLVVELLEA